MFNARGWALSPGKEERPCVRMKQRWDGQGEEEMKVRQADEELKRREAFIYIFFRFCKQRRRGPRRNKECAASSLTAPSS